MRWKLAVGWVSAHVVFFAAWAGVEQHRLSSGYPVHVRTAPVDPRDLLRGQYLALSYEFSTSRTLEDMGRMPKAGEEVWVVLRSDGEYYVPDGAYARRPEGLGAGRLTVVGRSDGGRIRFGIEEYYVPEGSPTPAQADTTVKLRVGKDGKPRIETVMVRGRPWP